MGRWLDYASPCGENVPNATPTSDGFMSASDKVKLDGLTPASGFGVLSLTFRLPVTSEMLAAGTPVVVPTPWVPAAFFATVSGGAGIADLVSSDGITAQVLVRMDDPSLVAGDQIVIVVTQ